MQISAHSVRRFLTVVDDEDRREAAEEQEKAAELVECLDALSLQKGALIWGRVIADASASQPQRGARAIPRQDGNTVNLRAATERPM
jgi:hypothetical protein